MSGPSSGIGGVGASASGTRASSSTRAATGAIDGAARRTRMTRLATIMHQRRQQMAPVQQALNASLGGTQ